MKGRVTGKIAADFYFILKYIKIEKKFCYIVIIFHK